MNARWVALLMFGCAGPARGDRVEWPREVKPVVVVASATTSERDGLRVLWNSPVHGFDLDQRAFVAGNHADFAALWRREVKPPAPLPELDFATHCVFGFFGGGYECPVEVVAVELEPNEVLRVRSAHENWTCPDVLAPRALVLAVPRRLLARKVTVAWHDAPAYSFRVPEPGEALPPATAAPASAVGGGEQVELPERGKIGLRRLANGTELWIAHHADGSVDALAATVVMPDNELILYDDFFSVMLSYRPKAGRIGRDFDARGRNVHGLAPLPSFAVTRTDATHVAVGGLLAPLPYTPTQPRDAAPKLEGPETPYSTLEPTRDWNSIPDGHVALLDADVVAPTVGPVQVCHAPPQDARLGSFAACPAGSPRVLGAEGFKGGRYAHIVYGPFVVRRQGATVSVTELSGKWPKVRIMSKG